MTTKIPVELVDDQVFGNRNVIINGEMQVAQRNTQTGQGAANAYTALDRMGLYAYGTSGRITSEQSTDTPDGFVNSCKLSCTTADGSLTGSDGFIFRQIIEGLNLQRFAKGTSSAKEFTVSFYVKGNASATYTCELYDANNTRQVSKTFAVTTSWNRIELTFAADTTGAFSNDNGGSLYLQLWLGAGSDFTSGTLNQTWNSVTTANRVSSSNSNFLSSTSNTFFITGFQLETGSQATPFEHRSLTDEINLCQRYYEQSCGTEKDMKTTTDYYASATAEKYNYQGFTAFSNGLGYVPATSYRIQKRITPSVTFHTGTGLTSGSPSANQVLVWRGGTWVYGAGSYTTWASSEASLSFHVTYPSISGGNETTSQLVIYGWVADAEL